MTDDTAELRRAMASILNLAPAATKAEAECWYGGQVWDTEELQAEFRVLAFAAPFVFVERKADGQPGSMVFTHLPRWYFHFQPANVVPTEDAAP